ncbi:hypothetical protein [Mesorhizobium sp. CN2-181]|uniref:hypothetical protein n=1 Tax=Mesorhizobium yinganensis TaxID=3157707 RepID=UPI0032B7FBBA
MPRDLSDIRAVIERGDIDNDAMARRLAAAATLFISDVNIAERLRDELTEAIDEPKAAFKILDRIEAASDRD